MNIVTTTSCVTNHVEITVTDTGTSINIGDSAHVIFGLDDKGRAALGQLFIELADLVWDDTDEGVISVPVRDLGRIANRLGLLADAVHFNASQEV